MTEKFKCLLSKLFENKYAKYAVSAVGILSVAAAFLMLCLPLVTATAVVDGVRIEVTRESVLSFVYMMFQNVGIFSVNARALVVATGIVGMFAFVTTTLMVGCVLVSIVYMDRRLVKYLFILNAVTFLLNFVMAIFCLSFASELGKMYGESLNSSAISRILLIVPVLSFAFYGAGIWAYSNKTKIGGLIPFTRLIPLVAALSAVIVLAINIFTCAAAFVPSSDHMMRAYVNAARNNDCEGLAAAYFDVGSLEYVNFIKNYDRESNLEDTSSVRFSCDKIEGNYAKYSVITTSAGREKAPVTAHLVRCVSGWFFMSDFDFASGNVYDGGTLIIEKLRYDYRPEYDDCVVAGVMGVDTAAIRSLIIPSSYRGKAVTGIAQNAFRGIHELESLTVRSGILKIGDYAFYGCENLKEVTLPDGVTIGNNAFGGTKVPL